MDADDPVVDANALMDGNVPVFDINHFKNAPLVCNTPFSIGWKLCMGFTAEKTFYKTNELKGYASDWVHDEGVLRLESYLYEKDQFTLITCFNYDSFQMINIDVQNAEDSSSEYYNILITFATTYPPMFWSQRPSKEDRKRSYICGRFYHQQYREAVKHYWNDFIDASAFQIFYRVEKKTFKAWMNQLYACLPLRSITFDRYVFEDYTPSDESLLESTIRSWPEDAKYYIKCIQSFGTVGHFFLYYRFFVKDDISTMERADGSCDWNWADIILRSMFTFLKKDISLPSLDLNPTMYDYSKKERFGTQYVPIKTAVVTPTRIRFELEEDTVNCRGFRKLGHQQILQVKFRDEDLSWFPRDENILKTAMLTPLIEGLFVGNKQYYDFGASSSLFREHGTYFLETKDRRELVEIINGWGKFKYEPAAKLAARLGQYFTSAKEIKTKLKKCEIGELDDYKSTPEQYVFSDGIGIMDAEYAREIRAEFRLHYTPCAFQIRCLGFKGMLTVDPYNKNLISNGGQFKVMFRDSQKKFDAIENGDIDLDVAQFAAPCPVKLHRSFIALLVALARDQGKLDILEKRLHELLSQSFIEILNSLNNKDAFIKSLKMLPKYFPVAKIASKNIINEPFLRSMVEAFAVFNAKLLNNKCQIPLPEDLGRSALGVVDETGLLKPGQIFFKYTEDIRSKAPDAKTYIRTGPIGVTKSPMYHLGDLRYLVAVDIPELHHLKDVVVFPNHGDRPIPDEIGGGDLDGDTYCVFWDEELLLKHTKAADYTAPDTSHISKVTVDELHFEHAKFRIEYEKLNNLEQISNCHLVHMTLHHPDFEDVERVARKADVAVNSFKSALFADQIANEERPVFNPTYMDKRHEPMFQTSHILCELHKRCTTFYTLIQLGQDASKKKRMLLKPTNDVKAIKTSVVARDTFKRYSTEIKSLMSKYKIQTEAELFANVFLEIPGVFNTYKLTIRDGDSIATTIQAAVFEIFDRYRTEFLNKFKPDWKKYMESKGDTFHSYMISEAEVTPAMKNLARMYYQLSKDDGVCLSFPWIAFEALDLETAENSGESFKTKFLKELNGVIIDPITNADIETYEKYYQNFDYLCATVQQWLNKEDILRFTPSILIKHFLEHVSRRSNVDLSVTIERKTFDFAFLDLLTMISSFKFKQVAKDVRQVYKAAQATLIQLAFSPELPVLSGTSLQKLIIPYPSFVISVPQFYSTQFQESFRKLKKETGCVDIAIRLRRNTIMFHQYTICCRGTLESCQSLEEMLTPTLEYDHLGEKTLAQMKEAKTETMQKLLEDVFGFVRPLHHQQLSHVHSMPAQINVEPISSRQQQPNINAANNISGQFQYRDGDRRSIDAYGIYNEGPRDYSNERTHVGPFGGEFRRRSFERRRPPPFDARGVNGYSNQQQQRDGMQNGGRNARPNIMQPWSSPHS